MEQVREELKRLGYFESGLDRFVLGGRGTPSTGPALARVGVRLGAAGGVLLGLALTVAAVGLDPRLLGEPRDLVVLLVYLTLALGAAIATAALLGGLAAAWAVRRLGRTSAPRLSRGVGLALALLGLLYLALWWRSHATGAPPTAQAGALVLGLLLSLLLFRFGSLAAVAVLSAGGLADHLPEAGLSRRNVLPLLAVAALVGGGGLAAASYLDLRGAPQPPEFAVVPTGLRVVVMGIDGLEAGMALELAERGGMPRLQAVLAAGAWGRLRPEPEAVPALVWTTIATGRGPEAHGILSTEARRLPGMSTPVPWSLGPLSASLARTADLLRITRRAPPSSTLRSVKAFWNIASEKGLRVGVVNWWATWPADPLNGFVVTDRAFLRLERGGPPDREVFPAEAWPRLRALPGGSAGGEALDRFAVAASRALGAADPPDLAALYLPGLDIVTVQKLGETPSDLASLDERLSEVRAYYGTVDGLIGEVVDGLGPRGVLVLVGDPGRLSRRSAGPRGILALAGPPIAAGEVGLVGERDVAPTLARLVGLPVSLELDGRALESALSKEFRREHPLRTVATYGRRSTGRAAESPFDRDVLEQLKGLGYIQ